MKKYLFTMATAAMLFASCSSDDTVVDNGANEEGLVEIKLGAGSRVGTDVSESKGRAAEPVDDWNNTIVGIVAVSAGETPWNEEGTNPVTVLLNDVEGTIESSTENGIDLKDGPWYYPRISRLGYNFFGYYPKTGATLADGTITTGDKNFTGYDDIMWAEVNNDDKPAGGYNADSFKGTTAVQNDPNLHFKHLTTLLKFVVKKGDDYDDETCAINNFDVIIPATYNLTVASQDSEKPAGTIVWGDDRTAGVSAASVTLPYSFDDTTDNIEFGQIFVKPGETSYSLILNIGNTTSSISETKELKLSSGEAFAAGKVYTITMTVNGPQAITLTATLEGWIDSNENIEFGI